jgi:hypothetical protein
LFAAVHESVYGPFRKSGPISFLTGKYGFSHSLRNGLALGRFQAHIPAMSTIVQCNCGAEHRRTEEKFLVPHTGDAICTVCGAAVESWCESTHVPSYELIERPYRKPERLATLPGAEFF